MKKRFFGIMAAVGFFVLYVAASTSDHETTNSFHGTPHPFWEFAAAGIIGLVLFAIGLRLACGKGKEE